MKTLLLAKATLLALLLACTCQSACAEDDGFQFPNLNPFKSEPKRTSASISDEDSGFSFPTLSMPSIGGNSSRPPQPVSRRKEPSMIGKVSQGTKSFFTKTYDFLTPWDNEPPPPPRYGAQRKPASKKFDWDPLNLFTTDEPEQEITTVNEFLALPRPQVGNSGRQ